jgi:hypothetical protein
MGGSPAVQTVKTIEKRGTRIGIAIGCARVKWITKIHKTSNNYQECTMKKFAVVIFVLVLANLSVDAQTRAPKVTERQVNQQQRINQGIKSGELTRREAGKLQAQQARVQHTKVKAKSDGVVTQGERAKIHHQQNAASRSIYRQKHDGQKRK